ncbi:rhomboid family intramembrane serine protease [Streptomyces sp. H10-C2]|uniref:rhomboid family intramembrane serine protease n=1 Tax=unclassified Streptomyces TaxID=2593676 RepID=UPI0024B8D6B1|nr:MULTISPECIES: rhomboid family intramembrane serine protease [unclassified Streptomyces]MDJ0340239.1 rhomboid family intramembrane serine protease [Streptomyces sp. PH10-H1]MDJ0368312.1 rhomboid family intramembrane serine protease [Streptomyces sp. H10-C2]
MDQAVCCYRHPDRETGIRCTRCERPICPECMVSASVGFQCPECLGEARRTTPVPRTVAGGTVASDPHLVTKILIGLNLAVFLLVLALGSRLADDLALKAYCDPIVRQYCVGVSAGPSQWYRLLSSVFDHQAYLHIGFNMLTLWWIGAPLEAALGRARYLALYLISGLGGSALVLLLAPSPGALGASGAIFGLFGATAVFMRRSRMDMRPILILLGLNLFFSFTWSNVSWQGHLGGLAAGTVIAVGMAYAPRERRALVQWGTCAAVLVVTLAASWIGVAQITA